jgi:hypothetical protein
MMAARLPKSRRRTRRRMTLIAAFRTDEGIAICADTQETVSDQYGDEYRATVQKVVPLTFDNVQLIIAGSGNADLIDAFTLIISRQFGTGKSPSTIADTHKALEKHLRTFYREEISLAEDKNFKILVAAYCAGAREYEAWVSETRFLRPIGGFDLLGWDHFLYRVTAQKMYRNDLSLTQAILAAVHVLTIAEQTSNCIRGPFTVSVVHDRGISIEESQYVRDLQDRLRAFEENLNYLLLACADTSVYSVTLKKALEQFVRIAISLHERQIDAVIEQSWKTGKALTGSVHKVPPGLLIETRPDGTKIIRHDVNGIEEICRRINESIEQGRKAEGPSSEEGS